MNDFDSKRWRQIEPLLDQALELSSAEVAAFLDRACAGDDGLRREVEALLRADASAGEFLERPAAELAPDLLIADDDGATDLNPLEGHRLGAWEIVREIGRGGMGAVYLARRADGEYRQIAALKLIKRGLDTDEILTRFRRERQILARLDHPQIARLLDGGATEGGLPYLVMEYVEGEPITAYCDRVRPSLETTLQLFIQVCLATEYAHRNLVIHRDLKPGNILVTSEGKVKLLDFGVARLLAGSEDEEDLETTAGQRRLTPNYAAPEQLRGEPSTTATDVYALGVVLYELLSGQRPYRRTGSPTEIERAVLEEIPMPPGAAAKNHGSRHAAWTDRIRGDLDNIVLAALKKDPAERYASATALREDVERFLTAIPVRATRPTWNYRAAKFIHRNRIAVTAAVLVGLSLLAGLVVSLWQVRVASHARDNAVVEARKASEIKGFVLDLFTSANPYQATDPDLTALQMVERGVTRVGQLRDQPEVQAEMLDVLGGVYREFDAFDRAESLVTAGYEIRRRLFGPHHPQVAQSLHHLGHIQFERGDYPAAESLMWESLSLRRALLPNDDDAVLTSMNDLAVILNRVDKETTAESLYHRSITLTERKYGIEHLEVALLLNNRGAFLQSRSRSKEALPILNRALAIRLRHLGREALETAITAELCANCYGSLGMLGKADTLLQMALVGREKWLGLQHADVARTFDSMSLVARDMGEFRRAESLGVRGLNIRRVALGPDHPDVGISMNNLAGLYYHTRNFDKAATNFEQVHRMWRKTLGENHVNTLTCLNSLGVVRREQGRYAESERILRDVLRRRVATFGPDDMSTSSSYHHLALLYHRQGRFAEAEPLIRKSVAIRVENVGDETQPTAQSQEVLGTVLRARGRLDEALIAYRTALATYRKLFERPNPLTADVLVGMGRSLCAMNRAREALPLLTEAASIRNQIYAVGDARTGEAEVAMGVCLAMLGDPRKAQPLLTQGLAAMRQQPGHVDPLVLEGEAALGRLASMTGGS